MLGVILPPNLQIIFLRKFYVKNKPIDITQDKNWQDIDTLITKQSYRPKLSDWYDKYYFNRDYQKFADMKELKKQTKKDFK